MSRKTDETRHREPPQEVALLSTLVRVGERRGNCSSFEVGKIMWSSL